MQIEMIGQDVRYAARSLVRAPGFSLMAIASLAAGIAACALVFSAAYRLHLRPLPFQDPEQLVRIMESVSRSCGTSCPDALSASVAADLIREKPGSLAQLALFAQTAVRLGPGAEDQWIVTATYVQPGLFGILGIGPTPGRPFADSDVAEGAPAAAILSERIWRRLRGAGDPVIGTAVDLDGEPVMVVGVLPADVTYPENTEIWLPLRVSEVSSLGGSLAALGRRHPLATVETLLEELDVRAARQELAGLRESGRGIMAVPEEQWLLGSQGGTSALLAGAVGLAFLIACTNLGNLFLVRSLGRRQAMFIRQAIGATGFRIARQLVAESLLVTAAGFVAGLVLASWGSDVMESWFGSLFHGSVTFGIDPRVVIPLAAAALIVGAIIGLVPMVAMPTTPLHSALTTARSSASSRGPRVFVLAQVVATVMLVAGATVLVRSYLETRWVDLELDDRDVLVVPLDALLLDRPGELDRIADEATARLAGLPSVAASAAWTISNPFPASLREAPLTLEDRGELRPDYSVWPRPWPVLSVNASPDFPETLGLRQLKGRPFDARDVKESPPVAILNEAAARRLWPGADPIGRRFKVGPASSPHPWLTVVGVVSNSAIPMQTGLGMSLTHNGQTDVSLMYRPLAQAAGEEVAQLVVAARMGREPEPPAEPVQAAIEEALSLKHVPYPITLRAWMSDVQTIERVRVTAVLLAGFAAAGLVLALMGISSVVGESVKHRNVELGIRMALGARSGDVVYTVLKDALKVTAWGLVVGLLGTVLVSRLTEATLYGHAFERTGMRTGLLYGVDALHPGVLLGACVVVLLVAGLGGLLPARTATRVDPAETLRRE